MEIGDVSIGLRVDFGDALEQVGAITEALQESTKAPDTSAVIGAFKDIGAAAQEAGDEVKAALDVEIPPPDVSPIIEVFDTIGSAATDAASAVSDSFGSLDIAVPNVEPVTGALDSIAGAAEIAATEMSSDFSIALEAPDVAPITEALASVTTDAGNVAAALTDISTVPPPDLSWTDQAISALGEMGVNADDARTKLNEMLASGLPESAATIVEAFTQISEELTNVAGSADGAQAGLGGLGDSITGVSGAAGDAASQLSLFDEAIQVPYADAAGQLSLFATELEPIPGAATTAAEALDALEAAGQNAAPVIVETGNAAHEAEGGLKAMAEQLMALGEALVITEGLREFGMEALNASDAVARASISLETLTHSSETARSTIEGLEKLGISEGLSFPALSKAATRMTSLLPPGTDVVAMLGKIADGAAVMGTNIGQASNAFDRMVGGGTMAQRMLMQLGLNMNDVAKSINLVSGSTDATAANAAKMFKALDQPERVEVLSAALDRLGGTAKRVAEETFGGQWIVLTNQWEQIMRQVGEALLPVISGLTDFLKIDVLPFLKTLVTEFTALPAPVKDVVVGVGLLAAAVVPLTAGLAAFGLAVTGIQVALPTLSALMVTLGITSGAAAEAELANAAASAAVTTADVAATAAAEALAVAQGEVAVASVGAAEGVVAIGAASATTAVEVASAGTALGAVGLAAVAAAPYIIAIGGAFAVLKLSGIIEDFEHLGQVLRTAYGDEVVAVVDTLAASLKGVTDELIHEYPELASVRDAWKDLVAVIKTLDWKDLAVKIGGAVTPFGFLADSLKKSADEVEYSTGRYKSMDDALANVIKSTNYNTIAQAESERQYTATTRSVSLAEAATEGHALKMKALKDAIEAANAALVSAVKANDGSSEAADKVTKAYDNLEKANKALESATGNTTKAFSAFSAQADALLAKIPDTYGEYVAKLGEGGATAAATLKSVESEIDKANAKLDTLGPGHTAGMQVIIDKLTEARDTLQGFADADAFTKIQDQVGKVADKFVNVKPEILDLFNTVLAQLQSVPGAVSANGAALLKWLSDSVAAEDKLDKQTQITQRTMDKAWGKYVEATQNQAIPVTADLVSQLQSLDTTAQGVFIRLNTGAETLGNTFKGLSEYQSLYFANLLAAIGNLKIGVDGLSLSEQTALHDFETLASTAMTSWQQVEGAFTKAHSAIDQIGSTDMPKMNAAYDLYIQKLKDSRAPIEDILTAETARYEANLSWMERNQASMPEIVSLQTQYLQKLVDEGATTSDLLRIKEGLLQSDIDLAHAQSQDASSYLIQLQQIKDKLSGSGKDSLYTAYTDLQRVNADMFMQLEKGFADLAINGGNAGDILIKVGKAIAQEFTEDVLKQALQPVQNALKGLIDKDFPGASSAAQVTTAGIGGLAKAAVDAANKAQNFGAAASSNVSVFQNLGTEGTNLQGIMAQLTPGIDAAAMKTTSMGGAMDVVSGAAKSASTSFGTLASAIGTAAVEMIGISTAMQILVALPGEISDLFAKVNPSALASNLATSGMTVQQYQNISKIAGVTPDPAVIAELQRIEGVLTNGLATAQQTADGIKTLQADINTLTTQQTTAWNEMIAAYSVGNTALGDSFYKVWQGLSTQITTEQGILTKIDQSLTDSVSPAIKTAEKTLQDAIATGNIAAISKASGDLSAAMTTALGTQTVDLAAAEKAVAEAIVAGDAAALTTALGNLQTALLASSAQHGAAELVALGGVKGSADQIAIAVGLQQTAVNDLKTEQSRLLGLLAIAVTSGDTDLQNAIETQLGIINTDLGTAQTTLGELKTAAQNAATAAGQAAMATIRVHDDANVNAANAHADSGLTIGELRRGATTIKTGADLNSSSGIVALQAQWNLINADDARAFAQGQDLIRAVGDIGTHITGKLDEVIQSVHGLAGLKGSTAEAVAASAAGGAVGRTPSGTYVATPSSAPVTPEIIDSAVQGLQGTIEADQANLDRATTQWRNAVASGNTTLIASTKASMDGLSAQLKNDSDTLGYLLGTLTPEQMAAESRALQGEITKITDQLKTDNAAQASYDQLLLQTLRNAQTLITTSIEAAAAAAAKAAGPIVEAVAPIGPAVALSAVQLQQAIDRTTAAIGLDQATIRSLNTQIIAAQAAGNAALVATLQGQLSTVDGDLKKQQDLLTYLGTLNIDGTTKIVTETKGVANATTASGNQVSTAVLQGAAITSQQVSSAIAASQASITAAIATIATGSIGSGPIGPAASGTMQTAQGVSWEQFFGGIIMGTAESMAAYGGISSEKLAQFQLAPGSTPANNPTGQGSIINPQSVAMPEYYKAGIASAISSGISTAINVDAAGRIIYVNPDGTIAASFSPTISDITDKHFVAPTENVWDSMLAALGYAPMIAQLQANYAANVNYAAQAAGVPTTAAPPSTPAAPTAALAVPTVVPAATPAPTVPTASTTVPTASTTPVSVTVVVPAATVVPPVAISAATPALTATATALPAATTVASTDVVTAIQIAADQITAAINHITGTVVLTATATPAPASTAVASASSTAATEAATTAAVAVAASVSAAAEQIAEARAALTTASAVLQTAQENAAKVAAETAAAIAKAQADLLNAQRAQTLALANLNAALINGNANQKETALANYDTTVAMLGEMQAASAVAGADKTKADATVAAAQAVVTAAQRALAAVTPVAAIVAAPTTVASADVIAAITSAAIRISEAVTTEINFLKIQNATLLDDATQGLTVMRAGTAAINLAEATTIAAFDEVKLILSAGTGNVIAAINQTTGAVVQMSNILSTRLPSFDQGGPVPQDMLAVVHAGEWVLNANTVKSLQGGGFAPSVAAMLGAQSYSPGGTQAAGARASSLSGPTSISAPISIFGREKTAREIAREVVDHIKSISPKIAALSS